MYQALGKYFIYTLSFLTFNSAVRYDYPHSNAEEAEAQRV